LVDIKTQAAAQWSEIKSHLQQMEAVELVGLLHQLYQLNTDNKIFLTSQLTDAEPGALAEPYREIIREQFNPRRGFPDLNLRVARKALTDFKKVARDPRSTIDLMLFYVEQGILCTRKYGDIDEPFYNSVVSVCQRAVELLVTQKDATMIDHFRPRLAQIVYDTAGMGWGFHDDLREIYENELPPKE